MDEKRMREVLAYILMTPACDDTWQARGALGIECNYNVWLSEVHAPLDSLGLIEVSAHSSWAVTPAGLKFLEQDCSTGQQNLLASEP